MIEYRARHLNGHFVQFGNMAEYINLLNIIIFFQPSFTLLLLQLIEGVSLDG